MFRHVPWKQKPTNRNIQKLLGENISKYLQTLHVYHFTTLDDFSNTPPVHRWVHNGAPATALIGAIAAIVASCHRSHHHGDSAQWLPGSRWGSSWHPNGWNLMNPREVFEKIRHQMNMMLVCLHVVAMKKSVRFRLVDFVSSFQS